MGCGFGECLTSSFLPCSVYFCGPRSYLSTRVSGGRPSRDTDGRSGLIDDDAYISTCISIVSVCDGVECKRTLILSFGSI